MVADGTSERAHGLRSKAGVLLRRVELHSRFQLRRRAVSVHLEPGDCIEVITRLVAEGIVVDSVVCDPPYHLLPTVKRFAATTIGGSSDVERRAKTREDGLGRLASGFMGQKWDGGDIAFRPETWATVATIMRPGAFLLAFGGTRTYHRLACAIEDGGFVIQDCIMWLFGTGFPKRRDMLKPAYEPVVLAYKPGGARTMQIDECRVEAEKVTGWGGAAAGGGSWNEENCGLAKNGEPRPVNGRWPANVCHDGSDEVVAAAFPESASGELLPHHKKSGRGLGGSGTFAIRDRTGEGETTFGGGSAARFFFSAKADAQDRWGSKHPTVKPVELMKWLVALVTPPGGTCLDPFAGSGTTGVAALATGRNCILIEREEQYIADIRERLTFYEGGGLHSVAAKNRSRKPADHGPLFAEAAQ